MISWIVITVLVVIGIFAIKLNHLKHRFFIIMIILLALFLYTSINSVTNKNSLDLKSTMGIFNAIKVYSGWIVNGFQNIKSVSGKVISLDWKSSNTSLFEKDSGSKNSIWRRGN